MALCKITELVLAGGILIELQLNIPSILTCMSTEEQVGF